MSGASAISFFGPTDSDWITTIRTRDGRVLNRRISPGGTMSEEAAISFSIRASELHPAEVLDCSARRAGDPALIVSEVDDHFQRLMRRLR